MGILPSEPTADSTCPTGIRESQRGRESRLRNNRPRIATGMVVSTDGRARESWRAHANHMLIVRSPLPRVVLDTGLSRPIASKAAWGDGSLSKLG